MQKPSFWPWLWIQRKSEPAEMGGADPCSYATETENISEDNFEFKGSKGMPYEEFLQRIRRIAFSQERSRDSAWMADLAALHLSGDALKWYESLDENVQQDWNLLRKAMARKYGDNSTEKEVAETLLPVKTSSQKKAKATEDPKASDEYLLPARIEISNWSTPALVSKIRFPKSESEWLDDARRRKAKFADRSGVVYWRLVETWEPIPENAIPTGNEGGTNIFSIRAWKDGSLTLGKQARGGLFWSHIRAWIPWYGGEVPWSGPFEILVGDPSAVRWVSPRDGRFHAVEGGFETGSPNALFIAQFNHMGLMEPGKAFSADFQGHFGWWLIEFHNRDFRILAWK